MRDEFTTLQKGLVWAVGEVGTIYAERKMLTESPENQNLNVRHRHYGTKASAENNCKITPA
jgi:hypothetical protein